MGTVPGGGQTATSSWPRELFLHVFPLWPRFLFFFLAFSHFFLSHFISAVCYLLVIWCICFYISTGPMHSIQRTDFVPFSWFWPSVQCTWLSHLLSCGEIWLTSITSSACLILHLEHQHDTIHWGVRVQWERFYFPGKHEPVNDVNLWDRFSHAFLQVNNKLILTLFYYAVRCRSYCAQSVYLSIATSKNQAKHLINHPKTPAKQPRTLQLHLTTS